MKNLFLARANPEAWRGDPAFLTHSMSPWYHVTCPYRLPNILRDGLLVEPPRHTFPKSRGPFATLGGIYLTPGGWRLWDVLGFISSSCPPRKEGRSVAVLKLRLPAGTRFCLDEDEIVELAITLPEPEYAELEKVLEPLHGPMFSAFESCYLAWRINQKFLPKFTIRVFDQPQLVAVTEPFHPNDLPFGMSRPSQVTDAVERRMMRI